MMQQIQVTCNQPSLLGTTTFRASMIATGYMNSLRYSVQAIYAMQSMLPPAHLVSKPVWEHNSCAGSHPSSSFRIYSKLSAGAKPRYGPEFIVQLRYDAHDTPHVVGLEVNVRLSRTSLRAAIHDRRWRSGAGHKRLANRMRLKTSLRFAPLLRCRSCRFSRSS
jgi:hypothetical protein